MEAIKIFYALGVETPQGLQGLQVTSTILVAISSCLDVFRHLYLTSMGIHEPHLHALLSLDKIWDAPPRSSTGKVKS